MTALLRRLLGTRVGAGATVGIGAMVLLLLTQLIAVPVLARGWGLDRYGSWLVLYTLPSLLAQGDLGLSLAGGTIMIDAVARGDGARAARVLSALRLVTLAIGGLAMVGVLGWVLLVSPQASGFLDRLGSGHGVVLLTLVVGYGLLALQNNVTLAASRAADDYAGGLLFYELLALVENIAVLAVALAGGTPLAAAATCLGLRVAGSQVLVQRLRRRAPWVQGAHFAADRETLRELAAPALASFTLPLANATIYQGAVVVIGAACGAAVVPLFTAIRTLGRLVLGILIRINFATQPRYTVASATGDGAARGRLVLINLAIAPAAWLWALVLGLGGGVILRLWTHGALVADPALLWLMAAITAVNAMWMPLSNLVVALNRQGRFSYFYLASALAVLGAGYVAAHGMPGLAGLRRIAWALLGQELAMLGWVIAVSAGLGILARDELAEGLAGLRAMLRRSA